MPLSLCLSWIRPRCCLRRRADWEMSSRCQGQKRSEKCLNAFHDKLLCRHKCRCPDLDGSSRGDAEHIEYPPCTLLYGAVLASVSKCFLDVIPVSLRSTKLGQVFVEMGPQCNSAEGFVYVSNTLRANAQSDREPPPPTPSPPRVPCSSSFPAAFPTGFIVISHHLVAWPTWIATTTGGKTHAVVTMSAAYSGAASRRVVACSSVIFRAKHIVD
jgi:hypothetical protein